MSVPASPLLVEPQLDVSVSVLGRHSDRAPLLHDKVLAQVGNVLRQLGGRQLLGHHLVQVPAVGKGSTRKQKKCVKVKLVLV